MTEKITKRKYIAAFLLFLTFASSGCKDAGITESQSKSLVVEAFLYTGQKVENVRISETLPLGSEDTLAPPVSDAQVILYKNGIPHELIPNPASPGYYIYNGVDLTVEPGNSFSIVVNYKGSKITSSTVVPQKPENVRISDTTLVLPAASGWTPGEDGGIPPRDTASIYLRWNNPDSSLYYVVIENLETSPVEINSGRGAFGNGGFMRRMTFPPGPTKEFVIARRNLTYYGRHKAIVYKVNQEYADLYESRNQDSRNLNEPLTNIINGLGVFSAFASQEVYFDVVSQ